MEAAIGGLGWTPETFWTATFPEFFAAVDFKSGETERRAKREQLEILKQAFPD